MNCVVVPVASQSLTGGVSHAHAGDTELSDVSSRVCKLANETDGTLDSIRQHDHPGHQGLCLGMKPGILARRIDR
jgi:hypothetical protein